MGRVRELFDADHETFRTSVTRFIEREVTPDRSLAEIFVIAGENGFLGIQIPEEYGGGGIDDPRFGVVVVEELMKAGAFGAALAFANCIGVVVPLLLDCGTPAQREQWLPLLAAGTCVTAVASLPGSPAAGSRLDCMLRNVVGAESAGLIIATGASPDGEVVVLLDTRAESIERSDNPATVALHDLALSDVRINGVDLSEANLLIAGASEKMQRSQQLWLAILCVAGARAVFDWTLGYVRDRKVFGRPVATFENTQYVLAGLMADITVLESFVDTCIGDLLGGRLTATATAAAKLRASELFSRAADQGMQFHGGYGYMREFPIAQAFADARLFRLYGGSSERMKEILAAAIAQY